MSVFAKLAARAERTTSALSLEASVQVVAARRGLPPECVRQAVSTAVRDATTGRLVGLSNDACRAKQEALYLATTVFGRSMRSVARAAGMSPPAVLKAVRAVEDRREEGAVDRSLDELELELMTGSPL